MVCTASAIPGYKPSDVDWYAGSRYQNYNGDRYEEKLLNALVDEQELENMRARGRDRGRDTLYVYMYMCILVSGIFLVYYYSAWDKTSFERLE